MIKELAEFIDGYKKELVIQFPDTHKTCHEWSLLKSIEKIIAEEVERKRLTQPFGAQYSQPPFELSLVHGPEKPSNVKDVLGLIGNVDHSIGNGTNAAKLRGEMLNDIRTLLS